MNSISKLTLSDEERQLINNSQWILTKHIIIEKVYGLLGDLSERIRPMVEKEAGLPPAIGRSTPKISKGENYLRLPYVLLDYPRCFSVENIFAVRTMFWWGNFFSMTLHLAGEYREMFLEKLYTHIDVLRASGFYLCINEHQWQHHFDEDNYTGLQNMTVEEFRRVTQQMPFIKLAVKFPLQEWDDIPALLERSFLTIMAMIRS